ncbi:hypothetical protein B0H13DRAFT_1852946 [Mycena leptocephala]|nr:hypothetical protein B0H13DRAFT_1852946 [Mycena leptocephala]
MLLVFSAVFISSYDLNAPPAFFSRLELPSDAGNVLYREWICVRNNRVSEIDQSQLRKMLRMCFRTVRVKHRKVELSRLWGGVERNEERGSMYVKIRETLEEKDKEETPVVQTLAVGTGDPLIPQQKTILEQRWKVYEDIPVSEGLESH